MISDRPGADMILLAIITLIISNTLVQANANDKTYGSVTDVRFNSCYDGDTCRFDIPDWPDIVGDNISVRIKGIDTPEMRGQCKREKKLARKAKLVANRLLTNADTLSLHDIERGKYFRIVARVKVGEQFLGKRMLDKDLAHKYDGGTKQDWCEQQSRTKTPAREVTDGNNVRIMSIDKDEEIVTIKNRSDKPVSLSGWTLVSKKGNQQYNFPDGTNLRPSQKLKVTAGRDARHNPPKYYKWTGRYIWNNSAKDIGMLINSEGEVVSRWPE